MSSTSSSVDEVLAAYAAGRERAERVIAAVAEACYRGRGRARERLAGVLAVIERRAPGVVELAATEGGKGFAVRGAERPFPKEWEGELRAAVAAVLSGAPAPAPAAAPGATPAGAPARPGIFGRLIAAVKRLFR